MNVAELIYVKPFPPHFLWGSATSAHQVEGNNTKNDWAFWENVGKIKVPSGMACDHYNRYKEDIDVLVSLHQNAYRMSLEWSRIEPEQEEIQRTEINHYRQVLKYLKEKKITTFLTLHHFTSPTWFDWERLEAPSQFAQFTKLIAKELGDLVDFWITINEPYILAKHGYLEGDFPPGRRSTTSMFRVLDNLIAGHNEAYNAIKEVVPAAQIGLAHNMSSYSPATKNKLDTLVTEVNKELRNCYILDRTQTTFIGVNYYSPKKLRFDPSSPGTFYSAKVKSDLPTTDMGWEIDAEGLYHVLTGLTQYGKPIYVTENGLADEKDEKRKGFIKTHLLAMRHAISDGADARGYLHWSLLDNFEWGFGYKPRFGLIAVDYATQKRTVRESGKWYSEVCRTNTLQDSE